MTGQGGPPSVLFLTLIFWVTRTASGQELRIPLADPKLFVTGQGRPPSALFLTFLRVRRLTFLCNEIISLGMMYIIENKY